MGLRGGELGDDGECGFSRVPGCAATDPLDEAGDVAFGKLLALGRHLEIAGLLDGGDELALVWIAGDDNGA